MNDVTLVFVLGTGLVENVLVPCKNSGKGTNNVVFTPHITSLLWNQGMSELS